MVGRGLADCARADAGDSPVSDQSTTNQLLTTCQVSNQHRPDPRPAIEDAKKAVRRAQPEGEDTMMFLLNLLGDLIDES